MQAVKSAGKQREHALTSIGVIGQFIPLLLVDRQSATSGWCQSSSAMFCQLARTFELPAMAYRRCKNASEHIQRAGILLKFSLDTIRKASCSCITTHVYTA